MTRVLVIFLLASTLHVAAARVSWQPNPETDIAGYRLQWEADGEAMREIEASGTSAAVDDLKPGVAYTFRICAVNTSGIRSGWSDSVTYPVPRTTPQRLRITLYSSDSPSREHKREEAMFFQPIDGPRRFWWAEIETP